MEELRNAAEAIRTAFSQINCLPHDDRGFLLAAAQKHLNDAMQCLKQWSATTPTVTFPDKRWCPIIEGDDEQ